FGLDTEFIVMADSGTVSPAWAGTISPYTSAAFPSGYTGVALIVLNFGPTAPNAPTLALPATNTYLDETQGGGITFAAVYNPADGSNMSGYQLEKKPVGGSLLYWNASTVAWQAGAITNPLTVAPGGAFVVGPIATGFANGTDYDWPMATTNSAGTLGAFAAFSVLNCAALSVV